MPYVFELTVFKDKQQIIKEFDSEEDAKKEMEFYKEIYLPEVKLKFKIKKVKKERQNE
jgi:hypothetical protein